MLRTRTARSTAKDFRSLSAADVVPPIRPGRTSVEHLEERRLLSATLTTVASFDGTHVDGQEPFCNLAMDHSGDLFGTNESSGSGIDGGISGTVFEVPEGSSQVTPIATFNGANGATPECGVYIDAAGDIFGTTSEGGDLNVNYDQGDGTVFEIPAGTNTLKTLVVFDGSNGSDPVGALIGDSAGNLYGTTGTGGNLALNAGLGDGTVFEISATTHSLSTIATFDGTNGAFPNSALMEDSTGNLYGVTNGGGPAGAGSIFKVAAGSNAITSLAFFDGTNGYNPHGSLIEDSQGNLYGTTLYGGPDWMTQNLPYGDGTAYELPVGSNTIKTLASASDGAAAPFGNLIMDADGDLYGVAEQGGVGLGGIFKIDVGTGDVSTIASFVQEDNLGIDPYCGLIADSAGNLFGTTYAGSSYNYGSVFKLTGSGFATSVHDASVAVTAPSAQSTIAGTSKTFTLGSFTETNATGPYSVDVNWGDGSADTKFTQATAGTITAQSHTFVAAKTDTVTVTVTDGKGEATGKATFAVDVIAAVDKLVFGKQPTTTVAGKAISPAVVVDVETQGDVVVTTDSSKVTLAIASGPTGAKLGGTVAVSAVKGVATFSDLLLDIAGSYVLKATDGSLTAASTVSFTVAPAAAAKLVFAQSPGSSKVGKSITPAVIVKVEDSFGNLVTTDKSTVKIAIATGPSGGKLTGTDSVAAVAGVATFSDLLLSKAGSYSLKATDGVLVDVLSGVFLVS